MCPVENCLKVSICPNYYNLFYEISGCDKNTFFVSAIISVSFSFTGDVGDLLAHFCNFNLTNKSL